MRSHALSRRWPAPSGAAPFLRALTAAAAVALSAACDSDGNPIGGGPERTPVATVAVAPGDVSLVVGEAAPLAARTFASDGRELEGRAVAWRSTNEAVARVSAAGVVSALGEGAATIVAASEGRAGEARVVVAGAGANPVPSITALSPRTVAAGGPAVTLTVTGTGFRPNVRVHWNGAYRPTGWISETEVRAVLSADDLAQPGNGQVVVINTHPGGGPSAPATLEIVPQTNPVASVVVRPSFAITRVGAPVPLGARLLGQTGAVLEGRHVTWTTSHHGVATVDGTGRVTAVGQGEATITATSEGRTATALIVVGPSTGSQHVLFDGAGDGLYAVDMRLGGATRIWQQGASDPSPSPDGRRVAYTLSPVAGVKEIAILDRYTRTYTFLGSGPGSDQPAWSPVGGRIVFRSTRGGRTDLWSMHADGSTAAVNLTADLADGNLPEAPEWSPTADRIAFAVRDRSNRTHLWVMNADGTGKRRLTTSPMTDTHPSWRGNAIVFTRRSAPGSWDLWRVEPAGTGETRLTHTGDAMMPSLSLDGRWIAFVRRNLSTGAADVMVARHTGEDARPLSVHGDAPRGGGLRPAWTSWN